MHAIARASHVQQARYGVCHSSCTARGWSLIHSPELQYRLVPAVDVNNQVPTAVASSAVPIYLLIRLVSPHLLSTHSYSTFREQQTRFDQHFLPRSIFCRLNSNLNCNPTIPLIRPPCSHPPCLHSPSLNPGSTQLPNRFRLQIV
jgi:hypothetical protein